MFACDAQQCQEVWKAEHEAKCPQESRMCFGNLGERGINSWKLGIVANNWHLVF